MPRRPRAALSIKSSPNVPESAAEPRGLARGSPRRRLQWRKPGFPAEIGRAGQSNPDARIVSLGIRHGTDPTPVHETIHLRRDTDDPPSAAGTAESPKLGGALDRQAEPAPSDGALVARMARGDERAMRALVDAHGGKVFALALSILRERADAEEVAADAFMQAWRNAAAFDPARSSVIAWLGVIARSRALDRLRARTRQERLLAPETESMQGEASEMARPDPEVPDRAAETQEARELVARALRELPESQRRVIELAYFGGLSQTEIAARLSVPLGTVKTRTLAAMRQLRARLGPLLREELA